MTRRTTKQTPTMRDRFNVTTDDLAEIFGDDFLSLTRDEALDRLHDTLARLVAEHDQAEALIADINRFTVALIHAVATDGTANLGDTCDTIATELGGHTEGTSFALTGIAALVEADERHHETEKR